jgi:hypothetical protein
MIRLAKLFVALVACMLAWQLAKHVARAQMEQCQSGCSDDVAAWGPKGAVVVCHQFDPANCQQLTRNLNTKSGTCVNVSSSKDANLYKHCPDCERLCANEVDGFVNRKHPGTDNPQDDCDESEAVYQRECMLITPPN